MRWSSRKEVVPHTECLDAVTSVSGGGSLPAEVQAERLRLVIYASGTNTGIKAVASGGHGHTQDELRLRRRHLSAESARAIAVNMANATFAARSSPGQRSRFRPPGGGFPPPTSSLAAIPNAPCAAFPRRPTASP
ncbi:hypothetical protein SALBM311S_06347 [Streptomyces alboniger]